MAEQTFVAVFTGAERLMNSENGNPRYVIRTMGGAYRTAPDTAMASEVANHLDGPHSWRGRQVRFTATMAGSITAWELAE